jgi:hypothetical protein
MTIVGGELDQPVADQNSLAPTNYYFGKERNHGSFSKYSNFHNELISSQTNFNPAIDCGVNSFELHLSVSL